MTPAVSIVIPTARRPGPLAAAAASALAQTLPGRGVELVIVDNDPAGGAWAQVEAMEADGAGAGRPVRYVHAAAPGVANARNAGVAAARGEFIAFLDDDEIAPPGWLEALVAVQARFDADAVFGPVRTRLPDATIRHRAYFAAFFARVGPPEPGPLEAGLGCGCSLVRVAALPHPTAPFAAARNRIGGEDDLLFSVMRRRGARFAWAPAAWVWEVPDPRRVRLSYTLRRAFAFGQGPCAAAAAAGPRRWPLVPLWMAVGAGQVLAWGGRALLDAVRGSPTLPDALDRAARGLGKILWFPPFKLGFYGAPARAGAAPVPGATDDRHPPLDPRPGPELRPGDPDLRPQPG